MKKTILNYSAEDNNSKQIKETEAIIYSKIMFPEGLSEAIRKEDHVQLETKFIKGQNTRVRKVIEKDGDIEYYFTFKIKTSNEDGFESNDEHTIEADESFFEGFKQVAEKEINKTRYIFSSENVEMSFSIDDIDKTTILPNIEYEVDVYTKPDGTISEWCKIDIEIDNILNFIAKEYEHIEKIKLNIKVKHLPFKPNNSILMFNASDDEKAFIDNLWKTEFSKSL